MDDGVPLPRQQKNEVLKADVQLGGKRWQAVGTRVLVESGGSAGRTFSGKEPKGQLHLQHGGQAWAAFRGDDAVKS